MGFKDLHFANLALLTEQGWRLITHPYTLWVRLMKSIHFPNQHFLRVTKKQSSSWGWKSLLHGRNTILNGCFWSVGDGSNIEIWNDTWIKDIPSRKLLGTPPANYQVKMVRELISWDTNTWDLSLIDNSIDHRERPAILNTPINHRLNVDQIVWLHDPKGQLTVKSAYVLISSRQ